MWYRRCKMHKRRVDLLNVLVKELNPQYYLNVSTNTGFSVIMIIIVI